MSNLDPATEYVTIYSSTSSLDAGMVRGYLESHGIEVLLRDEHMGSTPAYSGSLIRGIKVQVQAKDAEAAKEILKGVDLSSTPTPTRTFTAARIFIGATLAICVALILILLFK